MKNLTDNWSGIKPFIQIYIFIYAFFLCLFLRHFLLLDFKLLATFSIPLEYTDKKDPFVS